MARTNIGSTGVKPDNAELLIPHVVRRERISPHFVRVTLGGGNLDRFRYLGFDQWFRLFIPVSGNSLSRLPKKLDTLSLVRYLTISKTVRPVLRNYTVRAHRRDDAELDVDFVLHGSAADGSAGPAATWAETCSPGDPVGIIDEGTGFNPPTTTASVLLVADESGLPATAGILASLPENTTGRALVELPSSDDRQDLTAPPGVEVEWIVRADPDGVPGRAVLAAARALPVPGAPFRGWVVGEQALPTTLRRHWVRAGVPKEDIVFCGYWKHRAH
jgi:NADPH-dependent ferric siderophore reductase